MELKRGVTLHNTYRIIRVLGQGGYGITYLAEHILLDQQVAIKEFFPKLLCDRDGSTSTVRPSTAANTEQVASLKKKFLKEATHIAKLSHQHIIRIRDVFEENDTAYYVMDYINGSSLQDIVQERGTLAPSQAVEYINEIGNALNYIHSQHINHLDVKPGNIIINKKDNSAILIDFGLAKQYDASGHETSTTPIGLSHGYAPIEQYHKGGVKEFSPQTDVYSLAATLYYLLLGQTPPDANKLIETELKMTSSVPTNIAKAIRKAMQPKRSDRYESISAFLSAINSKIYKPDSDETIIHNQQQEFGKPKNQASIQKSNTKWVWILLGVIIVIAAAIIYFTCFRSNGHRYYGGEDTDRYVETHTEGEETEIELEYVTTDDIAEADRAYDAGAYSKALSIYLAAAHQDILENYNRLGWMYQYGQGTETDYTQAAKWYREGAERGDAKAQRNLGILYRYGNGVTQSDTEAVKWYQKAADQGDANAQNNLAYMYQEGLGVSRDYDEARRLYQRAADQGYTRAIYHLGVMYDQGLGVVQDFDAAYEYLQYAASEGDTEAQEYMNNNGY
ncbi:MAG: serine/threonine-protein kinase [Muribaculaceae bacterium]|nr:serine/threonine-protein kinase [Muribaculaceae bacterium]